VTLSACSTAAGYVSNSIGALSLSGAFLNAGASSVVGTLWDVGDEESLSLMVQLHASLRAGDTAAHAVRSLQKRLIADATKKKSLAWASLVVLGDVSGRRPRKTAVSERPGSRVSVVP